MVVQHNIQAMNANRMLNVTTNAQAKSTEKLSSGYKINRAADDAAGLSISEKMRKQIRGLDQASSNAEDGISAVQTAEGALTEVHDMLQRMNELAVQAANGTNSQSDRESIQDEIDQLNTEIDRVSETTKFNETYLLKGDSTTTASAHYLELHDAGLDGTMVDNGDGTGTFTLNTTYAKIAAGDSITIAGKTYDKDDIANAAALDTLVNAALSQANAIGGTGTATAAATSGSVYTVTAASSTYANALSFNLHVGADADMTNKIGVEIETMNSKYLGTNKLDVVGKKADGVTNTDDGGVAATYAIDAIADAVAKVSEQRSALGAIQNRLEHTVNNLDNVVENTTSAESRIRDTDMAEEMVDYSKNNILAQAGQSMLAQANQSNQGVLSLLQ